jgi:hypothetical protein
MEKFKMGREDVYSLPVKKWLLMAKFMTFFMLAALLQVSAGTYSQTAKFDLKMKNVTILDVFKQIEEESTYRFFFDNEQVDLTKKVNVDTENKELTEILDQLLSGTDLTYEMMDRLILVKSKNGKSSPVSEFSQQKPVSGNVTDTGGQPLPGVSVVVKGTTNGTVTNTDGDYILTNLPAEAILQFSFVGMKTQEVPVGNQTTISVVLEEETIGIEEVVAVGYGSLRRRDVTGSVTSVQSKQFEDEPMTSITQGMQGKIAGVNITTGSGAPGGNMIVRIRGNTSVLGSNDPLFVIDGFPVQ